jgi:hypothetical protein
MRAKLAAKIPLLFKPLKRWQKRLNKGLCVYCNKPKLIPGTKYCIDCKEKRMEKKREYRKKLIEERKCLDCGKAITRYRRCTEHRIKSSAAQRNRLMRRRGND